MEKITFVSCFKLFSNYLYIKQKAQNTITAYENDITLFAEFLKENLNNKVRYVNDFTSIEALQYQEYLMKMVRDKRICQQTAFRKYNSLKTFFRFINEKYSIPNILEHDKWGNTKKRKKEDFYLILEEEHIKHLIHTLSNSTDKNKFRDLVIFLLLITTGCRREDILNLRFEDISYTRNELLLYHSKTSSGQVVQLPPPLKSALLRYELAVPPKHPNTFVIRSRQSNSLSSTAYTQVIHKWVHASGIQKFYNKSITGHTFRHTFITNCIRNNISEQKIMDYTGHLDSATLQNYKHLVSKDHEDIANLYNCYAI